MPARAPLILGLILAKLVLMVLAITVTALLMRDGLALGAHVPRDPDEGWNAYLAVAAMQGTPLYPHGLMTNNYPPLSFYVVGALGRITGDAIVAGRIVSLAAFFALAGGIVVVLRDMGTGVLAALFGSLFFAAGLLIASDYVAMNDPQLLGHALQMAGLSLLLTARRETLMAAALMAAGLFVKHNLVALPLAAALWLYGQDRRTGLRFAAALCLLGVAGLILVRLLLGADLLAELMNPRVWAWRNLLDGTGRFLSWAGGALALALLLVLRQPGDTRLRLVALYGGLALLAGLIFSCGDGVDANIFFDAAIALALACGLLLDSVPSRWSGLAALLAAAPLMVFFLRHGADANFSFSEGFARQARNDIAFLKAHRGPALCENLSLCYWAGKTEPIDMFNLSQALKTGARREGELAPLFQTRHFGSIALDTLTPFAFGPGLKTLMLTHYRVTHQDDTGVFLEPR